MAGEPTPRAVMRRRPFAVRSLVVAFAVLAATAARAAAAPAFSPALWNSYERYEADNVPGRMLFAGPDQDRIFPLDIVFDVLSDCHGPARPFPTADAARQPGACEYKPAGADAYSFWQRLPGERLRKSNCYCYAVDRFEGGWCMPGLASGMGELNPATMSCADLSARVVSDGGVKASRAAAVSGPLPADGSHYIALFFRPQASCDFPHCGPDFHFARRDAGGAWSHKVGDAPATDRDSAGRPITDPEAARFDGGYTDFCGYFRVAPARVRVSAEPTPDRITNLLRRWKEAGLGVRVTPLPYDPAVDFVDEGARAKERAAMQRLQQGGPAAAEQQQQQQQGGGGKEQQQVQMRRLGPNGQPEGMLTNAPAPPQQQQQQKGSGRRLLRLTSGRA